MKQAFFHGMLTALFASTASLVYNYAYKEALLADFSKVINLQSVIGATVFGSLLASVGYFFLAKWVKRMLDVWFNIIFLLITFGSFLGPLAANLPMEIKTPELFIGLAIPMHLFPILFWLATKPLFYQTKLK